MAVPTKYPAMLQRADGAVAQVNDLNSYIGAAAAGFTFPTATATGPSKSAPLHVVTSGMPITPSSVVAQPGGLTTTIQYTKLNNEQDDGRY
jgi:hypothetical protein